MVKTISAQPIARKISNQRLLWAGGVTIAAIMAANTLVRFVAAAALQPDPGFVPLGPAIPAVFSLLGGLGAVILLAVIGRYSRRPLWLFQRIVLTALPISWLPNILLLVVGFLPGATIAAVLVLMFMHVVAVALLVTLFPSLMRE